ncbi:MAG: hypothetical protein COA79_10930 [Planctomycetota bacterium]|nr:MAG: hypothetical protein COA79_10930 [Planctomycetota bacterium]
MVDPVSYFNFYRENMSVSGNELRKSKLEKVQTKEDAFSWAKEIKNWFRNTIGELGQIENQKREYCGEIICNGYKIEKWLFEVFPGTMAPSNLYVPDHVNKEGLAMVAPLGHWIDGKVSVNYQNLGGYMATHGIPVLVYDHAGLGERREFWDVERGESLIGKSGTNEHCRIGDLMIPTGVQPANFFLTEVKYAIEFMKSLSYVNKNNVGISGASGGGSMSREAACYFDDLAFSVPVCILRGESVGSAGCHEQVTWNEGLDGVASFDQLTSMLPKPVMVVTEFIGDDSIESMKTLRRLYDLAGASDEVTDHFQMDDAHGYTHPMIEAVYRFLKKNFDLIDPKIGAWQKIKNQKAVDLNISKNGFLNREYFQISMAQQILDRCPKHEKISKEKLKELLRLQFLPAVESSCSVNPSALMSVGSILNDQENQISLIDFKPCVPGWYHGYGSVYKSEEADMGRWFLSFGSSFMGYRVKELLNYVESNAGKIEELFAEGKWALILLVAKIVSDDEKFPKIKLKNLLIGYRDIALADLNILYSSLYIPELLRHGDIDDLIDLCGTDVEIENRTDAFGRVIKA